MTFHFMYPTPLPSTKGWGPGYPDCQAIANDGPSLFWPGVHRDIAELVGLLTAEMGHRGFDFLDPGCWGFGCRGTKASSGSQSVTPSFHSWGLGFDINAPLNPFGNARENTQLGKPEFAWVNTLWISYGFFWLGPPIKDWMHWSFVGSPADARDMTAKARRELGDDVNFDLWFDGWQAHAAGEAKDSAWPLKKKQGWNARNDAVTNPKPGEPGLHDHDERYATIKHPHIIQE